MNLPTICRGRELEDNIKMDLKRNVMLCCRLSFSRRTLPAEFV
jgi:hypothetical protein